MTEDVVNHPKHYTSSPAKCGNCGTQIECIDVVEHMGFVLGNAVKYIWRADLKNDAIEDLKKAAWYLNREIERRTASPVEEPKPSSLVTTKDYEKAPLGTVVNGFGDNLFTKVSDSDGDRWEFDDGVGGMWKSKTMSGSVGAMRTVVRWGPGNE